MDVGGGFDHTIRDFLASGGPRDPERLRALLLDCPESTRRQQRGVVPALVAAFAEGIDTASQSDWTEISKRIDDAHACGEQRALEAVQIWATALQSATDKSPATVPRDSVDPGRTQRVENDIGRALERVGDEMRSGSKDLREILRSDDPTIGLLRVGAVLQTIHGVGPATTRKVLNSSGVDLEARVDQLSDDQRSAVCAALAPRVRRTSDPTPVAAAAPAGGAPIESRELGRRRQQQLESLSSAGMLAAILVFAAALLGGLVGVLEAGGTPIVSLFLIAMLLGGLSFVVGAVAERVDDDAL